MTMAVAELAETVGAALGAAVTSSSQAFGELTVVVPREKIIDVSDQVARRSGAAI